eukprot:Seg2876.2 transcript_id=Seg2876.2/GoldUCD/mRNA.D3Y31 product="Integral membrane protein DGCR2/IDD" protein_id=Seg2876.2/GoldUCD/D3Y31
MIRQVRTFILMSLYYKLNTTSDSKTSAGNGRLPCRDFAGNFVKNGRSFTVMTANSCSHCTCLGGHMKRCVNIKCVKPTCANYKTVPGKCCEYSCPNTLPISDTNQLAIILSLSIAFLIILILIIVVWRRTRKYKRYANDLQTECATHDQDATESIPNNQRQSTNNTSNISTRTAIHVELPPYAPPKKPDPETITPCEPPPPYTPQEITFV